MNDWPGFEIIAATTADIPAVLGLARHLNTVNLPADEGEISELLQRSEASFAGVLQPVERREYVFLLRECGSGRALGTSMVIGRLGRRDAPYIYFGLRREEMYSATLDRHFVHTLLDTTYVYAGPTELGGLVMDPAFRGHPERFGTLISFVRLLFIRMRRADFQHELLAELLPPFRRDGSSALWEAVGRRFTGLSYSEADRLSRRNKEFIRGLFPSSIYATLLDREAQALLGQVGPQTVGVEKLLRRIGFEYAERVDPFDGGPHFLAPTDEVTLVRRARPLIQCTAADIAQPLMVAAELPGPPYFRALSVPAGVVGQAEEFAPWVEKKLSIASPERVWILPWTDRTR